MHNTQPWRFRYLPARQTIELRADPARRLRFSDPAGRAVHIACGAALFNLRLAVLCTPSSTRPDWLQAGQALQRVLLTATLRGIAASPLTQPLETPDAWPVRDPGSGFEYPQMILRLGCGLPVPPSPRRPVSELLDASPAQQAD